MTPEAYLSRVDLIRSETGRVSALWRAMDEEGWRTPTFCPGWEAQHAVSHMTTGAAFYANSIRRGLEGLPPEPPYGKDAKEFQAIRAGKGEQLMALPRNQLMDAFDMAARDLQELYDRMGPDDLGKLGYHPRGLTSMDAWIGLRLVELVVHDWDIRRGRDEGARVEPQGVEGMLAFLPADMVRFFGVREKPPFEGRYLFRSTGPEYAWTITVSGEKAEFSPDTVGAHDAEIETDGEAHLLLLFGRVQADAVEQAGRLRIQGDRALAEKLLTVVWAKY